MGCSACGEETPKNTAKDFTKAVIEINNPETLVLLRKVVIPASMGTEEDVPAAVGKYHNVILQYEANNHIYLYSSDGIPTMLEMSIPQEILDNIEELQEDVTTLNSEVQSITQDLEDLKNSPDVVDIVDTYADLQDYDTSGLTDKDVIRVITDETKEGLSSYYRWNSPNPGWNFIGVIPGSDGVKELSSSDYNYPTANPDRVALWLLDNGLYTAPAGVMVAASTTSYPWYNTSDKTILVGGSDTVKGIYTFLNGKVDVVTTQASDGTEADEYTLLKSNQVSQTTGQSITDTMSQKAITDALASAGGVKTLTSADYNYPANDPRMIALWTLPVGQYLIAPSTRVLPYANDSTYSDGSYTSVLVFKSSQDGQNDSSTFLFGRSTNSDTYMYYGIKNDGQQAYGSDQTRFLLTPFVRNNLTSSNPEQVLSANQGRVLKDLIDSLVISGTGAPTTSTVGTVGKLYEDTTNGDLYICTAVSGSTYTWEEVGAGGGGGGSSNARELTAADYNYDSNNDGTDDTVALWLLDPGVYWWEFSFADGGGITFTTSTTTPAENSRLRGFSNQVIINYSGDASSNIMTIHCLARSSDTLSSSWGYADVVPLRVRTTDGQVVNYRGTNTTLGVGDIFADPGTNHKIQIGGSASVLGTDSVAIGYGSSTGGSTSQNNVAIGTSASIDSNRTGTVAIGASSGGNITKNGMVDFGSRFTSYGYNGNSNYRLLTGLYDPQSDHDAATKGYVDTNTPTITMQTTDPGEGQPLAENNFIGVYGGDPIIMDYSTSEVNTGAKWINGSAIYKKTISVGPLPNATSKVVAHNISNLDRVIKMEGYGYRSSDSGTFPLPFVSTTAASSIALSIAGANISVVTGQDRSNITEAYATLYYTKSS